MEEKNSKISYWLFAAAIIMAAYKWGYMSAYVKLFEGSRK